MLRLTRDGTGGRESRSRASCAGQQACGLRIVRCGDERPLPIDTEHQRVDARANAQERRVLAALQMSSFQAQRERQRQRDRAGVAQRVEGREIESQLEPERLQQ